ncbi:proline-specific peptidase [Sparassis latifolia]
MIKITCNRAPNYSSILYGSISSAIDSASTIEGTLERDVPGAGKLCTTWYKVYGDLKSGVTPLVALHGGPGIPHDYLISLADLTALYAIPLVLYDQLGCGNSTHLPEKSGDGAFWTEDLFLAELDALLKHLEIQDHYDLLGHSWGGMFGARHAVRQPKGLRRLIISDTPAAAKLWVESVSVLLKTLPKETQETLLKHEAAGTYDAPEYKEAVFAFYKKYMCRLETWPEALTAAFGLMEEDPTVYMTMWGSSEFHVKGTLKGWSILDELHKISVQTLLLNARYDEAQDVCVQPFFKGISKVKWYTFAESGHMPHWDEREHYVEVVAEFLKQ